MTLKERIAKNMKTVGWLLEDQPHVFEGDDFDKYTPAEMVVFAIDPLSWAHALMAWLAYEEFLGYVDHDWTDVEVARSENPALFARGMERESFLHFAKEYAGLSNKAAMTFYVKAQWWQSRQGQAHFDDETVEGCLCRACSPYEINMDARHGEREGERRLMGKASGLKATLHWYGVESDDDARWRHDLALYTYLAPVKDEIYYLGKCDRTSVRGRSAYSAKSGAWDCINARSKTHRLIVAELEVKQRLTRQLLADIESLLIFTDQAVLQRPER
jgi:hypothetical protein